MGGRDGDTFLPTNGVQAALVEIDKMSGKVAVLKHWVVEDCGRVINPLLVDEQIRGGVVQGIGEALYEYCRYTEDGQFASGTLADYLLPMAADTPDIVVAHVETPYSGSLLGAKGSGRSRRMCVTRRHSERSEQCALSIWRTCGHTSHFTGRSAPSHGDAQGRPGCMKPAKFAYAKPSTIDEVLALLREHGDDAAVLSGGQTLVPMLNLRVASPQMLIDINDVPGLDEISVDGSILRIGARSRHNDVLRSELVQSNAPLVSEALHHVAHEAIRNRGTLGGSLALADPAAEMPACMVCLDAEIVLLSEQGTRSVPAPNFFQGIYDTDRRPDELIVRIDIPIPDASWRFAFHEISRRHGDFAMAGLTFGVRCAEELSKPAALCSWVSSPSRGALRRWSRLS